LSCPPSPALAAQRGVDRQHDEPARRELLAERDDVVRVLVPAAAVLKQDGGARFRTIAMRQIQVRRHAIMADAVELDAQAGEPVELAIDLLHRIERCVVIDVERHRRVSGRRLRRRRFRKGDSGTPQGDRRA